ncbi:hypothetical protein V7O62_02285 [Methanolobus sp. ZRKC2]|uniref:hypothetical protein n=1 Tax=Methanolobus sp. ZRKC2 TaxID=3125783 RepID=UPI0032530B21
MNNSSLVQYGSDFLVSNNEVFLSHSFVLEYQKVMLVMFLMGFLIGSGFTVLVTLYAEKIREKLDSMCTSG